MDTTKTSLAVKIIIIILTIASAVLSFFGISLNFTVQDLQQKIQTIQTQNNAIIEQMNIQELENLNNHTDILQRLKSLVLDNPML
jgi:wobble nucleotide-excising tRNase